MLETLNILLIRDPQQAIMVQHNGQKNKLQQTTLINMLQKVVVPFPIKRTIPEINYTLTSCNVIKTSIHNIIFSLFCFARYNTSKRTVLWLFQKNHMCNSRTRGKLVPLDFSMSRSLHVQDNIIYSNE